MYLMELKRWNTEIQSKQNVFNSLFCWQLSMTSFPFELSPLLNLESNWPLQRQNKHTKYHHAHIWRNFCYSSILNAQNEVNRRTKWNVTINNIQIKWILMLEVGRMTAEFFTLYKYNIRKYIDRLMINSDYWHSHWIWTTSNQPKF